MHSQDAEEKAQVHLAWRRPRPTAPQSSEQLMQLYSAHQRRCLNRGLQRKQHLLKCLRKTNKEAPPTEPEVVKTHLRDKTFNLVELKPETIGHYLGQFSITYKPVEHGRKCAGVPGARLESAMEAYEQVQKGPLKLKGVAELGVAKRKKKKKDKDKAKMLEAMGTSKKSEEEKRRCLDKRTPAQAAFEKMQEKRVVCVSWIGDGGQCSSDCWSTSSSLVPPPAPLGCYETCGGQMERILKKASKTHKQRVEDFNRHLDTLTEHYDIPKVSWTK
ncbi:Protein FAM32A [Apodemus speciosus]|uniref:Protein FAM32A n=2 Tax=Euarchontoglires TaxID=314146 RepID=A0ABQ0F210_APOSI